MESCPAPILARGPRAGAFGADVPIQVRCLQTLCILRSFQVLATEPNSFCTFIGYAYNLRESSRDSCEADLAAGL